MSKKKKIRPLGEIYLEMEPLILEAMLDHDLQYHDFLGDMYGYLGAHCPNNREIYVEDGTSPVFYYGHHSGLNKKALKKIKRD